MGEPEPEVAYRVVVNDEAQYSIWPIGLENPPGWHDEGTVGSRAACLAHIRHVWTDLRPLSLRRHMVEQEGPAGRGNDETQ